MKVKALTNFAGAVCMVSGETRNITDEVLVKDLIGAGYVEAVEEQKEAGQPDSGGAQDTAQEKEPAESRQTKRSGRHEDKPDNGE